MKPKRIPWPRRKKTLVWSPDGRPPGGGADGGALPLLHPGPGHSSGGIPRRHRAHPGGDGTVGGKPAPLLLPKRPGADGHPLPPGSLLRLAEQRPAPDGDRQDGGPGRRHRRRTPLLGTATAISPSSTFSAMWTCPVPPPWWPATPIRSRPPSTPLWNSPAAIPQTGETAGYFWETVTLPGGTIYLHPDQLTVLDQAGHPLCTYDLTNHWGYASYPLSETR